MAPNFRYMTYDGIAKWLDTHPGTKVTVHVPMTDETFEDSVLRVTHTDTHTYEVSLAERPLIVPLSWLELFAVKES